MRIGIKLIYETDTSKTITVNGKNIVVIDCLIEKDKRPEGGDIDCILLKLRNRKIAFNGDKISAKDLTDVLHDTTSILFIEELMNDLNNYGVDNDRNK